MIIFGLARNVVGRRKKFTDLYESCVADMKITNEEYKSLIDKIWPAYKDRFKKDKDKSTT